MNEIFQIVVLGIAATIALIAFFQVVASLFPRLIALSIYPLQHTPSRAFFLGLANAVLLGVIFLLSFALGENTGVQILYLPAVLVLVVFVPLASFALSAMVVLLGERLLPTNTRVRRFNYGGLALILACLTPYVGWFVLLPFVLIYGICGVIIGLYRASRERSIVDDDTLIVKRSEEPDTEEEQE